MKDNMTWHIPFKGRNHSGTFNCNFLWQKDNVYVMDNHRLALWCWLRHIRGESKIEILHIDQHYDCRLSCHDQWLAAVPINLEELSLSEYINYTWQGAHGESPLFRFDNYLSLFLDKYREKISSLYISSHKDGDFPNFNGKEFNLFESLGYINARCSGINSIKCIINIDLDYFTETGFGEPFIVVTDEYIAKLSEILKTGLDKKQILCLTLALSPEFVGSWDMAESLFEKINNVMDLGFEFPQK